MAEEPLFSQETTTTGPQSSWFGKTKLLLFAVGVIVVECVVAYLLIPAAATPALAAPQPGKPPAAAPAVGGREKHEDETEVDLGKFGVTSFQPSSNSTLLIDFHLYGTVATTDKEAFGLAMEESQHRFRDQVLVIVRSAELTELTDAGLGLLKRKILEKSNKTLGKPFLRSVIFSDFSFVEQ
jgi:flagellar FliL protein